MVTTFVKHLNAEMSNYPVVNHEDLQEDLHQRAQPLPHLKFAAKSERRADPSREHDSLEERWFNVSFTILIRAVGRAELRAK
jgi:hypothetical protein